MPYGSEEHTSGLTTAKEFQAGQQLELNRNRFDIVQKLGSGAVADVYEVKAEGMTDRLVLKVTQAQGDTNAEEYGRKKTGIKKEAETLAVLNRAEGLDSSKTTGLSSRLAQVRQTADKRNYIALIDAGELADGSPYTVQEFANGKSLESRPVNTIEDEKPNLQLACRLAQAMETAHSQGIALKDFQPETKGDRIRVVYSPDGTIEDLKLIDFNISGGSEDFKKDLIHLGGHLYYLFTDNQVQFDAQDKPPAKLGVGVASWRNLAEGSRQILQKALNRDSAQRYQNIGELKSDLEWWKDTLVRAGSYEALEDRLWRVKSTDRHDRVLAICDLALKIPNISGERKKSFELWRKQATDGIENLKWLPLADLEADILNGQFGPRVMAKATEIVNNLEPDDPIATYAKYLILEIKIAQRIQGNQKLDIRKDLGYSTIHTSVEYLMEGRYAEVSEKLQRIGEVNPTMKDWEEVKSLANAAKAGSLHKQAVAQLEKESAEEVDIKELDLDALRLRVVAQYDLVIKPLEEASLLGSPEAKELLDIQRGSGLEIIWRPFLERLDKTTAEIEELRTRSFSLQGAEAEKTLEQAILQAKKSQASLTELIPPEGTRGDSYQEVGRTKLKGIVDLEVVLSGRIEAIRNRPVSGEVLDELRLTLGHRDLELQKKEELVRNQHKLIEKLQAEIRALKQELAQKS